MTYEYLRYVMKMYDRTTCLKMYRLRTLKKYIINVLLSYFVYYDIVLL